MEAQATQTFTKAQRRPTAVSQVLRALDLELSTTGRLQNLEGSAKPFHASAEGLCIGVEGKYVIRVASSLKDRQSAWKLAYDIYLNEGYIAPNADGMWYDHFDALPETVTLLVERERIAVATLTLVFDSSSGLPGDAIGGGFKERRRPGRRLCQIVKLASRESGLKGALVMKHLFKLAYAAVRERATDFVVTVNARHAEYYERVLLFTRSAGDFWLPQVAAPVALLQLDLLSADDLWRRRFGSLPGSRNQYSFFHEGLDELRDWIAESQRALDLPALLRFVRPRLPASAAQLDFVHNGE